METAKTKLPSKREYANNIPLFKHFYSDSSNWPDDDVFKVYRREYKKRFAWIKAGRIEPEAFYALSEQAREKKAQCEVGTISLEEFSE